MTMLICYFPMGIIFNKIRYIIIFVKIQLCWKLKQAWDMKWFAIKILDNYYNYLSVSEVNLKDIGKINQFLNTTGQSGTCVHNWHVT